MSSWVKCTCGRQIHKNLFAGAKVSVVVVDEVLDEIQDNKSAGEAVTEIIAKADLLVRCDCGRIAIEDRDTGQIHIYVLDKT